MEKTRRFLFTALSVIAPRYAIQVMQARMMQRLYEGAQNYPSSDWHGTAGTSANAEIEGAQKILIARSRDLARNNPYAIKAMDVIVSNTVGSGIVAKIKGRTKRQEKEINKLWKEVCEGKLCDSERRHDFYNLQCLAMQTIVESGEVLALKSLDTTAPSIQLLEPDHIDSSKKQSGNADGSDRIVSGIALDQDSRRTGYYLFKSHPGELGLVSLTSNLIPAKRILHVYKQTRPGQIRGVPWSHAVSETLKDFADFQYATIIRQKISACLVGFITTNGNENLLNKAQVQEKRKKETKMVPGSYMFGAPGEGIEFNSPPAPQGYGDFIAETIRAVACGYGITYESISNDYSRVNFSSGRMGHLEMKRNIEKWRWHMLIPHFCDPYFKFFLEWCKLKGVDTKDVQVEWVPPAYSMIDPSKEIAAEKEAVKAGFKSKSQVIREQGLDPDSVREDIKKEREADEAAGLNFDVYSTAPAEPAKPDVEDKNNPEPDDTTEEIDDSEPYDTVS